MEETAQQQRLLSHGDPPFSCTCPHLLLQLTAMYRPSCWWMAPFVLLRKALVVAAFTLVTGAQVWVYVTLLLNSRSPSTPALAAVRAALGRWLPGTAQLKLNGTPPN